MADRSVHYEAAFEAFIRARSVPYVAVDEAKKALFSNSRLKSFDFVVYSPQKRNLLVDVKGRQAKSSGKSAKPSYQNWVTQTDVDDLIQWQDVFGGDFIAVFAFMYWIDAPLAPLPNMFEHHGRWYEIVGLPLVDYREHMRHRSAKWGTVHLPTATFQSLARPINDWL